MPIFEITGDDIALLNDEQLRMLIGRLCEAELRRRDQSAAHVTWGGNQNATDGGIDVRVALPAGSPTDGFIPRPATGFQAKKQDMARAAIIEEMCPNGTLRPAIQALADKRGAYIIVSSEGSTADLALDNRRAAMAEAIDGGTNADGLALDFYDRNRVATWVRSHEGLIPLVRAMIGKPIPGWQSYGPWAAPVTDAYLSDDQLRIHPGTKTTEAGRSTREGIQAMRDHLRAPRQVVRLVGLSGVGKTRLVQALFDDRVGEHSLNLDLAIYTNLADGPEPPPTSLTTQLIAAGARAILVIDNCPPDLHQRLAELCRRGDSNLSLLTVEYDIREDEPEGTDIYKLETSSPELIQQLVGRRFPNVSAIDARTIAELSGGNARIALAIAGTIGHQESLAGLTDEQVFQRLFVQRHAHDDALYLSAQACSLVYSFQGEDISDDGELARLGRTIGRTPQELYRSVAELHRRDLVQQRSNWRAVLPHAIANRLAAVGLQNIPHAVIQAQLMQGASERLLRSFSRRLGYLHASNEAVAIVRRWVGPEGLLSDVANLNEFGQALFENIAPVVPADVLAALERALTTEDVATRRRGEPYLGLLRSLAYDPLLFERSTALMESTLTAIDATEQSHGTQLFVSLFHVHLSGTYATIEQRLGVVTRLLASPDDRQRALGVLALRAVLEATHFSSSASFDFGARSRDFGYRPRTPEQVHQWFSTVLKLVEVVALPDHPISSRARTTLALSFRGLWRTNCVADELNDVCRAIASARFWPEGWLAVRQTLDFDGKAMPADLRERLISLETALRPADLEQRVRAVVFPTRGGADFEDYDEDGVADIHKRMARAEAIAQELGMAIAADEPLFTRLLPEIVSGDGLFWPFGMGLMEGAADSRLMWLRLTDAMTALDERSRQPLVLRGFLRALQDKDPGLVAQLLDEAVEHETHSSYYPYLQVAIPIGEQDVARLKRSLALGRTPARAYVNLAYGRATDPIPPAELRSLILALAALPDGYDVALELLHMRLHADGNEELDPALIATGQDLLRRFSFTEKNAREDYRIGEIARACLGGEQGSIVAQELCAKLRDAVATHATYGFYHDDLLQGLFHAQPFASLNGLCSGDEDDLTRGIGILHDVRSRKDLIGVIPEEELLRWCDEQPNTRYPAIAGVLPISHRTTDTDPLHWTTFALRFLEKSPDPTAVLKEYVDQFTPHGGWSGSLAVTLEANATLLDELDGSAAPAAAIALEKERLREAIERQRQFELAHDRERDERFE
jgi:hypothetical protein